MLPLLAAALLSAAPATAAASAPLWLEKELTPELVGGGKPFHGSWKLLSANRFHLLGMVTERSPDGARRYRLLDLADLSVVELAIPFREFPAEHLATLGVKELQGGELVHHDGEGTTLLVDQMNGWKRVATWLVRYDHRARRFSRLVKVAEIAPNHFLHPLGFDASDARWWFADVTTDDRDAQRRPIAYDLARVDLRSMEIDWRMTLELPPRARRLSVNTARFSPDGRWLALVEYDDRAGQRDGPAKPQAQLYAIDVASRRVDTYPIPLSAYGVAFTPDSRFLLVGSHEEGTILRLDLADRKQTHQVQATRTIHEFHVAPGGDYFLVVNNYELSPRKVVDVRRTSDLALVTSLPIADLFPGCKGSPGFHGTMDGRYLFSGSCGGGAKDAPSGLWVYRPPERIEPPASGSAQAARLKAGETIAAGKAYGKQSGIELSDFPMGAFTSAALTPKGNALVAGARNATAVVAKVGPNGRRLWERVLPNGRFQELAGGVLGATADEGCVAYWLAYAHPGADPNARLARLDANGKVLWDLVFAGGGAPDAPYANDGLELLPDGSVRLRGVVEVSKGVQKPWTAVVSAAGKLVSSEPPVAPPRAK
jgi:hypothetical protein